MRKEWLFLGYRMIIIRFTHHGLVAATLLVAGVAIRFLLDGLVIEAISASIIGLVFYTGTSQMEKNHSWLV